MKYGYTLICHRIGRCPVNMKRHMRKEHVCGVHLIRSAVLFSFSAIEKSKWLKLLYQKIKGKKKTEKIKRKKRNFG